MKGFYFLFYILLLVFAKTSAQTILIAESFEDSSYVNSWTFNSTAASGVTWTSASTAFHGSKAIRVFDNINRPVNAWAFTPALPLNATNPVSVSLYVKRGNADHELIIKAGRAPDAESQTIALRYNTVTSIDYTKISFTFTPETAGNYYIGFNAYSGGYAMELYMDSITIRQNPIACAVNPAGGNAVINTSSLCIGSPFIVNVNNSSAGTTGLAYQWQSSADNNNWADVPGQIGNLYINQSGVAISTYYRRKISCGGSEAISTAVLASVNSQPAYASLPFTEGFEYSWESLCNSTNGLPSYNWRNQPLVGNSSWRRDNEGATAGWMNPSLGGVPFGAYGTSRSARFHATQLPANSTGDLSLYLNCSAGLSTKEMKFYAVLGDSLNVQISTDGGASFSTVARFGRRSTLFDVYTIGFTSVSANTVIRFSAKSSGTATRDIQIDELSVNAVSCFTPLALTVRPLLNSANYTIEPSTGGAPGGYEYAVTQSATPPASGQSLTSLTGSLSALASSSTYYMHVRTVCPNNRTGSWLTSSFTTATANCIPQQNISCSVQGYVNPYNALREFKLTGENATSINKTDVTCTSSGYYDFSSSTDVILAKGKSYSCLLGVDTSVSVNIWIDFNDDGAFTYNEKVVADFNTPNGKGSLTPMSLFIAGNAPSGRHKLRVRLLASDPCAPARTGQTHDYTITVIEASAGAAYSVSQVAPDTCIAGGDLVINEASNNNNTWVPITDGLNNIIASIHANGNNLNRINVFEYINGGTIRTNMTGIPYLDRNVQISVATQPLTNVGLRIYITQREFDSLKKADPTIKTWNDLWMTRTSQPCGSLIGAGQLLQPVNSANVNDGFYVEYNISGFSSFFFQNNSLALPVRWSGIQARNYVTYNLISWNTETEINNSGFELEKSNDGILFVKIGFIRSKAVDGNSLIRIAYQFEDKNILQAGSYYRLKQIDKDGKAEFSNVLFVAGRESVTLNLKRIFPIPVKNILNLDISSEKADEITVTINDPASGIRMMRKTTLTKGGNQLRLDISALAAGTYYIKIASQSSKEILVRKFLKMK